jgi:ATP-dependent DNA helicase RecQ
MSATGKRIEAPACDAAPAWSMATVLETVRSYWGYDKLRPLQAEAIRAGLQQRDSMVVLPTGGGKSLCYQVPAAVAGRTDVVVSPLIALMKDQVDGLRECGYPAAALHSGLDSGELRKIEAAIAAGEHRLVFVAPERLLTNRMLDLLRRLPVRAFAIDEAHCISQWGHDFRPEYRQLAALKQHFPQASVHAYTATATPQVREDIVRQLRLKDPCVLVGTFDRPNLVYRIIPRSDVYAQTLEVVRRHAGQAVIVYCLSRRDTEKMAEYLNDNHIKAAAYHAGMQPEARRRTQDAFAEERLDVITATVAFGMGIDRSDVRAVVHATMPKSIEHYQQETGRAGRDGLEAECVLFYSAGDIVRWEKLIEKSAAEAERGDEVVRAMKHLLNQMQQLCSRMRCRHQMLSEYFGQSYPAANCGACDVCLEEMESIPDGSVVAQKILSCVARVKERFGTGHVADVLLGAETERIREHGHAALSTYGLLKDSDKKTLANLMDQLIDHGLLERTRDEYPVLKLNPASWEVLRGARPVRLIRPKLGGVKRTKTEQVEWEGVDRELFESLRGLRREVATERGVPAFVVFGDATLRELARIRPGSLESLLGVRGIGERKAAELGERVVQHIVAYCQEHKLELDAASGSRRKRVRDMGAPPADDKSASPAIRLSQSLRAAFELFADGCSIEEAASTLGRARSTTVQYLTKYILTRKPKQLDPWVDEDTYQQIAEIACDVGTAALAPIFNKLEGRVPYDVIRLVTSHLSVQE